MTNSELEQYKEYPVTFVTTDGKVTGMKYGNNEFIDISNSDYVTIDNIVLHIRYAEFTYGKTQYQ